jgi:hypothetical protein
LLQRGIPLLIIDGSGKIDFRKLDKLFGWILGSVSVVWGRLSAVLRVDLCVRFSEMTLKLRDVV